MAGFSKKIRFSSTGLSRGVRDVPNFENKEEVDIWLAPPNPAFRNEEINP